MRSVGSVLAICLLASCASSRGARQRETRPLSTGSSIVVDGVSRGYRLHAPPSTPNSGPMPLLFVFHGAGSDADDIEQGTGFDALADGARMLVVCPEGAGGRFDVDPGAGRTSTDVRFVDVLLAELRTRFAIDDRRVFASGFSNGAAFCYRLAADRPALLAAIAPVAGYLPSLAPATDAGPVPLLHVHGTADGRVGAPPLVGGTGTPVPAWARRNGATRGPDVTTPPPIDGLVVKRAAYSGSTPRADAVLLLVEGAGHEWPGGPGGPISRAILEFFRSHPRT